MSAKAKLLSFIGSLFIVGILLTSSIGYANFKHASVADYTDKLQQQADLVAKAVEQRIERYFDGIQMKASELAIDANGQVNEEEIITTLVRLKEQYQVTNAYLGLKNGDTYGAIRKGKITGFNAKELNREWYKRGFSGEKTIITTPYESSNGFMVMALAVPVTRNGLVVAVLCLNLPLTHVTDFINTLTENNQIWVSRDDGFLLASKYPNLIGKNLFQERPSYKAYQHAAYSSHSYTSKGEDYFVVSHQLKQLNWTAWSWDSWQNINESSNFYLLMNGLVSISLMILSLIIIYNVIVRLMYIPVGGEPKEIEQIVKRVSQGDLSLANRVKGTETGIYAATLAMVESLHDITGGINDSVHQINNSSNSIESASGNVTQSSESQMKQLEQTSAAMNQMTVTVDEVARNALEASSAATDANDRSDEGIHIVSEMNNNITTLVNGIEKVLEVTNRLEQETVSIGGILDVIDGISEQTNLLALNAAIEAARAGGHGRGFAVVADEVRNLANRTKASTNEIQEMITRLQAEAKTSVQLMQVNVGDAQRTADKSASANSALEAIRSSVAIIHQMNSQIATAAEEQTNVANEINISVVDINELAKITFNNSKNNSQLAKELADVATSLSRAIEVFKF